MKAILLALALAAPLHGAPMFFAANNYTPNAVAFTGGATPSLTSFQNYTYTGLTNTGYVNVKYIRLRVRENTPSTDSRVIIEEWGAGNNETRTINGTTSGKVKFSQNTQLNNANNTVSTATDVNTNSWVDIYSIAYGYYDGVDATKIQTKIWVNGTRDAWARYGGGGGASNWGSGYGVIKNIPVTFLALAVGSDARNSPDNGQYGAAFDVAQVWIMTDIPTSSWSTIDADVNPAILLKFRKPNGDPVNLGPRGENTGITKTGGSPYPDIYLTGKAAGYGTNGGTVGDFTFRGSGSVTNVAPYTR